MNISSKLPVMLSPMLNAFYSGMDFVSLLYFTITFLCFMYLIYWATIKPIFSPAFKIPGDPYEHVLFGHVLQLEKHKFFPFVKNMEWAQKYGGIYRFNSFLNKSRIVISDPDFIKYVTVTNAKNYIKPDMIHSVWRFIVGQRGLLLSNGEIHHVHHKLISRAFRISFLKTFLKIFERTAEELLDFWNESFATEGKADEVEVNVHSDLSRMTLDALGQCGFGYKFDCIKENSSISSTYSKILEATGFRGMLQLIPFNYYLPTRTNLEFWKNLSIIHNIVDKVIAEKKSELKNSGSSGNSADLLDILLMAKNDETGQGLSDQELREEVMTFILAGHETTGIAMSWILLMLTEHPDIQKKVREEIIKTLPPKGTPITWEHLEAMTYLTCVINETMRIYSPVPFVIRETLKDDQIGGYTIPKGTVIFIYSLIVHRLEQYWPDPMTFNPDRFMEEPKPFTFIPFVAGPRMCIGYKFAQAEMKLTLALLLKEFIFTKDKNSDYKPLQFVTMRPNPSLKLIISKISS